MSDRNLGLLFVAATIIFTLYSQIMIKLQVNALGPPPAGVNQSLNFILRMVTNPWVLSGFLATLGAGLSWMLAVSRLSLSYAYPFMSISFPSILLCSYFIFKEPISRGNLIGTGLIVLGIIVHSRL